MRPRVFAVLATPFSILHAATRRATVAIRFIGFAQSNDQKSASGTQLASLHFVIIHTETVSRRAIDSQRARIQETISSLEQFKPISAGKLSNF